MWATRAESWLWPVFDWADFMLRKQLPTKKSLWLRTFLAAAHAHTAPAWPNAATARCSPSSSSSQSATSRFICTALCLSPVPKWSGFHGTLVNVSDLYTNTNYHPSQGRPHMFPHLHVSALGYFYHSAAQNRCHPQKWLRVSTTQVIVGI